MTDFSKYTKRWEQAMRCGLMRGRPYSEPCIATYMYYVDWFLKTYHIISVPQFKQAMMHIPITNFAKRLKLYEAINCFVRYLNDENVIQPGYLEEVKKYKPKRHLPIQKKVVDEVGIEKLLAVCKTPVERMVIHLLSQTGLRATEAGNLLLEDVDLEKGYLVVKVAKWGKTRRVGLTAKAKESIEKYLSVSGVLIRYT